jgi:hypothetical protein
MDKHIAQGRPVSAEWGARQRFYHLRRSDNPSDAAGLLGLRVSLLQDVSISLLYELVMTELGS